MADLPPVRPVAPEAPVLSEAAGTPRRRWDAVDLLSALCGLFAFFSLGLWGFTAWPTPWNIVVGIGAPLLALLVWALFVSPRAVLVVHPFVRALAELLVYVAATVAWWWSGQTWIGLAFAVVAVTVGLVAGRRRLG